jgi:hypothetical protein
VPDARGKANAGKGHHGLVAGISYFQSAPPV